MLRKVRLGDNIGSGFRKIMAAWKAIGYTHLDIHEESDVNEVWLTLPLAKDTKKDHNHGINVPNDGINVPNDGINVPKKNSGTIRREKILELLILNPDSTTDSLMEILGVSRKTISRDLVQLSKEKKLTREGAAFGGRWIVYPTAISK